MVVLHARVLALVVIGVLVAGGPARAAGGPVCFPLPPDYKVRVDVDGGSAIGVAEALEQDTLPTGGLEGAPHGEALDGWRCLFSVRVIA